MNTTDFVPISYVTLVSFVIIWSNLSETEEGGGGVW